MDQSSLDKHLDAMDAEPSQESKKQDKRITDKTDEQEKNISYDKNVNNRTYEEDDLPIQSADSPRVCNVGVTGTNSGRATPSGSQSMDFELTVQGRNAPSEKILPLPLVSYSAVVDSELIDRSSQDKHEETMDHVQGDETQGGYSHGGYGQVAESLGHCDTKQNDDTRVPATDSLPSQVSNLRDEQTTNQDDTVDESDADDLSVESASDIADAPPETLSAEHQVAQKCLDILFDVGAIALGQGDKYLSDQGREGQRSLYHSLLEFSCKLSQEWKLWIERNPSYLHPSVQEEIAARYSNAVLRRVIARAKKSKTFSIILDGVEDVRESVCIRYVNDDLKPREDFLGLYNVGDDMTGTMLATCVQISFDGFQLSIDDLRGQAYNPLSDVIEKYADCGRIILQKQPLAARVHCLATFSELLATTVCISAWKVESAVSAVKDLGEICNMSYEMRTQFDKVASSYCDYDENRRLKDWVVRNVKPLSNRYRNWIVRLPVIAATVDQYKGLPEALEDVQEDGGHRLLWPASSLLPSARDPITVMCLSMARHVLEPLEVLKVSLQSSDATAGEWLECAKIVRSRMEAMREDENEFDAILANAELKIKESELEELTAPRRWSEEEDEDQPPSTRAYFIIEYRKMIDTAIKEIDEKILDCAGFLRYVELETMLLTGKLNEDIARLYPELYHESFQTQLNAFHGLSRSKDSKLTLSACCEELRNMDSEARDKFREVEGLVRLLLINPASTVRAERSFGGLRRLKEYLEPPTPPYSWLSSYDDEEEPVEVIRSDNVVCHVHAKILHRVNKQALMKDFVMATAERVEMFGLIDVKEGDTGGDDVDDDDDDEDKDKDEGDDKDENDDDDDDKDDFDDKDEGDDDKDDVDDNDGDIDDNDVNNDDNVPLA